MKHIPRKQNYQYAMRFVAQIVSHKELNNMAAILQMTFSNAFSWKKKRV